MGGLYQRLTRAEIHWLVTLERVSVATRQVREVAFPPELVRCPPGWVGHVVIGRKFNQTSCFALSDAEPLFGGQNPSPSPFSPSREGRSPPRCEPLLGLVVVIVIVDIVVLVCFSQSAGNGVSMERPVTSWGQLPPVSAVPP